MNQGTGANTGGLTKIGSTTKPMSRPDAKKRRTGLSEARQAHINRQLMDWYQWQDKMLRDVLGFPSDYRLDRIPADKPCGSRVPVHGLPKSLAQIDRALMVIPAHLRLALDAKYCHRESDYPPNTLKAAVSQAYCWIDGYLTL